MPSKSHAAFLSYSSRYREWVGTLHRNLELCLEKHGETRPVFFDQADLHAGQSWVAQLQSGLEQADQLGASGLLDLWLHRVQLDNSELLPYFEKRTEVPLLDQVYVQLQLRGELPRLPKPDADAHFGRALTLPGVLELTERQLPGLTHRFRSWCEAHHPAILLDDARRETAHSLGETESDPEPDKEPDSEEEEREGEEETHQKSWI